MLIFKVSIGDGTITKLTSPNGEYTLNIYKNKNCSNCEWVVEIKIIKNNNVVVKDIYYDEEISESNIEWIDDNKVKVDNEIINVDE